MNEDDKADHNDALAHQHWLEQNDTDPHHIHIEGLSRAEVVRYLIWHKARLRTINRVIWDATAPYDPSDRRTIPFPLTAEQKAHHTQMIDQLKAMLPAPAPQRAKPLSTRPPSDSDRAAEVVRYAHLHGITVRQAATILAREGANR